MERFSPLTVQPSHYFIRTVFSYFLSKLYTYGLNHAEFRFEVPLLSVRGYTNRCGRMPQGFPLVPMDHRILENCRSVSRIRRFCLHLLLTKGSTQTR